MARILHLLLIILLLLLTASAFRLNKHQKVQHLQEQPSKEEGGKSIAYKLWYHNCTIDLPCSETSVNVSITLPDDVPASTSFEMVIPIAIPSDYTTQPYDTFIEKLSAEDSEGNPLAIRKAFAGPVWKISSRSSATKPFQLKRVLYSPNLKQMEISILAGGDSSRIRPGYVGINGISVFAYIDGLEDRPIDLMIEGFDDWPVFTTLAPQNPAAIHRTNGSCENYYALTDSQIAMGPKLQVVKHTVRYKEENEEIPIYVAVYTEGPLDIKTVGQLAKHAMKGSLDWFGRNSPFPEFTYFIQLIRRISPLHYYGWSLEHLQSVTLVFDADGGVQPGANNSIINSHLYNLVHHTLHAWIPKRSYGEHYYPFTWQIGPVFDSIWFAEGFVQYVAALVTQNLTADPSLFMGCLVDHRFKTPLNSAPAFIRQMDLAYLSSVASTQYSSDWRIASNLFSRGAMMAMEMDTMIQQVSLGRLSLREALRWTVAWSETHKKPFSIDQLPAFFLTATGVDTRLIYRKWLKAPLDQSFPLDLLPSRDCETIY